MRSPSARKVWIEMLSFGGEPPKDEVTFRKEGVDWNPDIYNHLSWKWCHLPQGRCGLKFDNRHTATYGKKVTFRKEGVDWNVVVRDIIKLTFCHLPQGRCGLKFDIRKAGEQIGKRSPSARKVWIEIVGLEANKKSKGTSPSARKVWIEILSPCWYPWRRIGHLPQGRCGLK